MLAMVDEPALRDELDRVAAAVGVRVVHVSGSTALTKKTWSAATAVVLDEAAAGRCGQQALPRRSHVVVVSGTEPAAQTWAAGIAVGAQQVLALPAQERELVRELADAAESTHDQQLRGRVVAVIGGRGGGGASVFAAALALTAETALLVDLDPWSGGIDLLLGCEDAPGLRWPDLAVRGGRLDFSALREALPRRRRISTLSGTRSGYELDPGPVEAVIDAGRRGGVTVICDVARRLTDACETALQSADLVVVVSPCDVPACAATATIVPVLSTINPNTGLVARGPSPGGLRAAEVAAVAAVPLLASMKAEPGIAERLERGGLRLRRRSALANAARRVLAVLPSRPAELQGSAA
jgi:secretion/DNA translocation related CpaE-like protein